MTPAELDKRFERLKSSGIPSRHRAAKMETLKQSASWLMTYQATLALLRSGGTVAITGKSGTGKTQIGVECIRRFCADGKTAVYITAQEIFDLGRDSFNRKQSERATFSRIMRAGLLVVDECHERGNTEYEARIFSFILDGRYREMLPSLLLANLTIQGLEAILGPSISDRINEGGSVFLMDIPSFRSKT